MTIYLFPSKLSLLADVMVSLLPELTATWQETLHWSPNETQATQFQQLYERILAGNQHLNLTRITEPMEFWEKHLWDSVRGILPYLQSGDRPTRIIDIGTGGGFPGIPVAIALQSAETPCHLTLLDSTRKKIEFVKTVVAGLGLEQVEAVSDRAEQLNRHPDHRGTYDLAMLRAVGSVVDCAEYTLPFLKAEGQAILYRGNWTAEEAEALQPTLEKFQSKLEAVDAFVTPLTQGVRHCLYLRKLTPEPAITPSPRKKPQ